MSGSTAYGFASPLARQDDYSATHLAIQQVLSRMQTATLVEVTAISGGFLTVQPMLTQIDGAGNTSQTGPISGVPYLRLQGGANAVIIDPQVGDKGICLFASRDISTIKSTGQPGNPGSRRRFHRSDGLYLGGVLNGTPVQYISFLPDGIHLHAPTIFLEGNVVHNGTFLSNAVDVGSDHRHIDSGGNGTGGPPQS